MLSEEFREILVTPGSELVKLELKNETKYTARFKEMSMFLKNMFLFWKM